MVWVISGLASLAPAAMARLAIARHARPLCGQYSLSKCNYTDGQRQGNIYRSALLKKRLDKLNHLRTLRYIDLTEGTLIFVA